MTNWYQGQYEAAMEESVRKAEATLQQFRCMAMANRESSTNWGANSGNLGANSANFVANGANLGVSMVNFGYPPPNSPLSSSKFPPLMSNHYGGPPPTSANYEGHQTNDMSANSFLRSQTESYYQDSLYRDSNFGVYRQSNSNFGFSYSRTVLVKIHSELYPISREVLDWFFYGIGKLESIECFDQCNLFHSRICFHDRDSTLRDVHWLDGSCIYNGCCQVELILEAETIDRANEMDASNQQIFDDFRIDEPVRQNPDFSIVDELQDSLEGIEDPSEAEKSVKELSLQDSCKSMVETNGNMIDIMEQMRGTFREIADELRQWREEIEAKALVEAEDAKAEASIEEPNQEIEEVPRELQIQFRSSEVNSYLPNPIVVDIAWKERDELVNSITMADFGMILKDFLVIPTEPLGLVVISEQGSLSEQGSQDIQGLIGLAGGKAIWIVDMGMIEMDKCSIVDHFVCDPGGGLGFATLDDMSHLSCKQMATLEELMELDSPQTTEFRALIFSCWSVSLQSSGSILVFDPGGVLALIRIGGTRFLSSTICYWCEKIVDKISSIRILSSFILSSTKDNALCSSCCSCYYIFAVLNYPWAAFFFDKMGSSIVVANRLQWDPGGSCCQDILGPCIS